MSAPVPIIGQVFGHYRLVEQIGAGGMGVVYRAFDEQLQRDVALKILPHGLFADAASRDRFRREALAVGKLNHPNIAMAFDFGESGGVDYLVTEYISGINLDEKIGKQPLPLKAVLDLGIQLMSGLEAAHRAGVIHRDLKPGNIRINRDGQLKVLDFGLAKMTGPIDDNAQTENLAAEDSVSGTLPYMSPELLRAEPADARADIWAAGAVLYEMASGKRAFPDKQPSLIIDTILHYDPVRPTLINQLITPQLEAVILKALDRDPDRRYQSARELRVDLQRLLTGGEVATDTVRHSQIKSVAARSDRLTMMLGLVAVLLGGLSIGLFLKHVPHALSSSEQKIMAVLPIETLGHDPDTNALGLGLTETLTAKLVQASGSDSVQVVSPRDLRDQSVKTAEDARREFGTDLVLESSLQRSGDQIRINCYLVDSRTHRQVAARSIEMNASDSFALQDQVVNAVLDMLPGNVKASQRRALAARHDTQPAAYEAYIRGRGYLQEYEKPENITNAIREFEEALKIDPRFAAAYAGIGEANWIGFQQVMKGGDWIGKASRACQQALSLDPQLVEGHVCLGNVMIGTGKYAEAVQEFQRAVASDGESEEALHGLADAYTSLGNFAEAEQTYKKVIALRPNYWGSYHWMGLFYFSRAQYADAIAMFQKTTQLAPDNYRGYLTLGGAYDAVGRYPDALNAFQRSISLRPNQDAYNNLGYTYILMHRYADAITALQAAMKINDSDWPIWGNLGDALYWSPERRSEAATYYQRAIAIASAAVKTNPKDSQALAYLGNYYAMLGDKEQAFASIRRALEIAPNDGETLCRAAVVYNHFGEAKQALTYLMNAVNVGYSRAFIRDTPDFASLQQSAQFQALVKTNP